jgi:hypothetical protein
MEDNFQIKSTTVAFADEAGTKVEQVVQKVEAAAAPMIEKVEAVTASLADKVMDTVESVFHIGDTEVKE